MTTKYFIPKPEAVKVYPDGREVCQGNAAGEREYQRRKDAMQKRQGGRCAHCNWYLGMTFDHEAGRGLKGGHRDDRIEVDGHWQNAALCYKCNADKASKRYHWQDGQYLPADRKA